MTHVASSSSVNGSSQVVDNPVVFNLTKESDVLALLRAIHRSTLKQKIKNELRDLLFGFKQGADADRAIVIATLAEAGFTATYEAGSDNEVTTTAVPVASAAADMQAGARLGRTRRAPQFAPVASAAALTETDTPVSTPVTAAATPMPPPPAKEPVIAPEPVASSAPEPAPQPVAPVQPTAAPESAPVVSEAPTPTAAPTATPTANTDPGERIKEIKRLVAEKVGNPIKLLDIDNQIGREYMNALLGAMKTSNGGRPEEVAAAMSRLEKAYQAAIEIAQKTPPPPTQTEAFVAATTANSTPPVSGFAAASSAPAVAPAATEPSATVAAVSTPAPAQTETSITALEDTTALDAVASVEPVSAIAEPEPIQPPTTDATPVKIRVNSSSLGLIDDDAKPTPETTPEPAPAAAKIDSIPVINKLTPVEDAPPPPAQNPATPSVAPVTPASTVATPSAAGANPNARLMSVAKEEQLQSLMRQNQVKAVASAKQQDEKMRATTDPLQLPEVTAGLKQLLSEWSLFKSSGFFGTGPGGVDHPLYQKMASLTMAAVIAGRFEGASPQVKQSITDYMNGWRYEEGIVHEHTETFEHYLRRVIKHILDNKGKK